MSVLEEHCHSQIYMIIPRLVSTYLQVKVLLSRGRSKSKTELQTVASIISCEEPLWVFDAFVAWSELLV